MILLDSDLEPDAALAKIRRGKRSATPVLPATSRKYNLPTARTFRRFLGEAQAAVGLRGQVTVLLTTDTAIRRLNWKFRGKDKATDVLSFPAEGIGTEEIAGDLAISVPTALRQAIEQGHGLSVEIKVLMLHGLLHLTGYDHENDQGQMARCERILRGKLGLPQGLIERAGGSMQVARKIGEVYPSGPKTLSYSQPLTARLRPPQRAKSALAGDPGKARPDTKPLIQAATDTRKRPARAKRP